MHNQHVKMADVINDFKFRPETTSPPPHVMSEDQKLARNFAIIDLTNKLADVLAQTSKTRFNRAEWIHRALGVRK